MCLLAVSQRTHGLAARASPACCPQSGTAPPFLSDDYGQAPRSEVGPEQWKGGSVVSFFREGTVQQMEQRSTRYIRNKWPPFRIQVPCSMWGKKMLALRLCCKNEYFSISRGLVLTDSSKDGSRFPPWVAILSHWRWWREEGR